MATVSTVPPIVCPGHSRPIVDLRFCHTKQDNLNLLLSSCHDKNAQLRWADNGAWIGTYKGHNGAVWSAAMDEAGLRTITGSADFSVKLWNTTTGEELASFAHNHVVKAVDWSFDSTKFLSAELEKKAFIFDVETKEKLQTFHHPCRMSKSVWISENTFVTGGYDGVLRFWDSREASSPSKEIKLVANGASKKGITDIEFVRPLSSLVTCINRKVARFELRSEKPILEFEAYFDVEAASLSPNGKRIVTGGSDLWLHVYDASSAQASELTIHKGHHGPIFCTRWDTQGENFASGSEDGTIRIWPVSSL